MFGIRKWLYIFERSDPIVERFRLVSFQFFILIVLSSSNVPLLAASS